MISPQTVYSVQHDDAPSKAVRFPQPLVAARLMPKQLMRKPANLKKANLEMDLSSLGVLDKANMERRTAGVSGLRRLLLFGSEPTVEDVGSGVQVVEAMNRKRVGF